MNEREKNIRFKIREECWEYEDNFSGMDVLIRLQNDWKVAQEKDNYKFENCPSYYKCLENFVGLCESTDSEYSAEQCERCWMKALKENEGE